MKSIKAILAGSLFIFIVTLLIQLAVVFLIVGYNYLAGNFPLLHEISIYFRYFVGYPVFFLVLFTGGYITASVSEKQVLVHCFLVGLITISITTVPALSYMKLTLAGMIMVLLALVSIMAGGLYWQRKRIMPGSDPRNALNE